MRDVREHTRRSGDGDDAWVDEGDGDTLDSLVHLGISISIDNGSEWMSDLLEHRGNSPCVDEEVTPGGCVVEDDESAKIGSVIE